MITMKPSLDVAALRVEVTEEEILADLAYPDRPFGAAAAPQSPR
jgi:hypothetical protein